MKIALRFDDTADLAQALYYAAQSVRQLAYANPHDAPISLLFEELSEEERQEWLANASRLAALHQVNPDD